MKKDFIPVSPGEAVPDDAAFQDRYWSGVWGERSMDNWRAYVNAIDRNEQMKVMRPYLSGLPSNSRILDGGCGLGHWTLYFAAKGFRSVGIDISRETIARLQERLLNVHRAFFVVGDIRAIACKDASFDAYLSWGTFEHFEEGLQPCLQEAWRVLKPSGHLFITVPFYNRRHIRRDRLSRQRSSDTSQVEAPEQKEMRFYQWRLTKSELRRELELGGFKVLEIVAVNKWQGLRRMVKHELHVDPTSKRHRIMQVLLYPFVSKDYVAHMLMGVGQKQVMTP
ncbi:hypothetical protein AMJ85_08960 [candidate division BRC1 bacterium SM23_51]|nr:MAG: hypothetical protein AMJ85_08960 [candidate division BRC1 bacterium SM23_51]